MEQFYDESDYISDDKTETDYVNAIQKGYFNVKREDEMSEWIRALQTDKPNLAIYNCKDWVVKTAKQMDQFTKERNINSNSIPEGKQEEGKVDRYFKAAQERQEAAEIEEWIYNIEMAEHIDNWQKEIQSFYNIPLYLPQLP